MARITTSFYTHGGLSLWWWLKWAFDSWRLFRYESAVKISIQSCPSDFGPLGGR